MKTRYKFLRLEDDKIRSASGDLTWEPNKWCHVQGDIDLCSNGLHCSVRMFDAISYVPGEIVARIEVKGKHDDQDDKQAWRSMKLIDVRLWTKADSVALSVYASLLCIENYEKVYPNDDRPRKAIEAAAKWLAKPTEGNRKKAEAARSAARSAAESAAESAAWSAAESAAWSAARSAAWSAESAAWSAARSAAWSAAESAAWSAARSAAIEEINSKINEWMEKRFDDLTKWEDR